MSAQTHSTSLPPPPPTSRGVDRLRGQIAHYRSSPNPVWIRELRQSARLLRTPFILMTVTALTVLLLAAIGGIMAGSKNPASTGMALHHTFFSIAFFVVTLAGPTVAANSIASEREGRTWEALQLTGLPPGVIARGKFLAAYTNIAMYIVMLAPAGALPFLFGGVTATEVVLAFVWLFLIGGISVAFGLALSSKMDSLRVALVVTLLLAFALSPTVYVCGLLLSIPIHAVWPAVPEGPPVWLPTAYERADFGWEYLGYLVVAPLASVLLPAWFLYEVTIANLTQVSDDRSTGVRRWFVVTTALLSLGFAALSLAPGGSPALMAAVSASLFFLYLVFCAFTFAGEPIGPSRRVQNRWERARASRITRMLGPGVMRASLVLLFGGLVGFLAITAAGLLGVQLAGGTTRAQESASVVVVGAYGAGFFVFTAGFTAWMRARANSTSTARVLMLVVLFFAAAGPWIVAAIAGAASRSGDDALVVASPSPFYALVAASQLRKSWVAPGGQTVAMVASFACAATWAFIGLALLGRAALRCSQIIRDHAAALSASDRMLADEDARAAQPAETAETTQTTQPAPADAQPS